MADKGKVEVELVLLLSSLKAKLAEAGRNIREAFAPAEAQKAATGVDKVGDAVERVSKKSKQAAKDMRDAWRASLPPPIVTDNSGSSSTGKYGGPGASMGPVTGSGLATAPSLASPYSGAAPPHYAPPVIPSSGIAGLTAPFLQTAAMVGAALAGLRVALGLLNFVVSKVVSVFNALNQAAAHAASIYAQTVRGGGMSISYNVNKNLLASVLGVGTNEVMHFGVEIHEMSVRLAVARETITATIPTLTATSYRHKELAANMSAVWMQFTAAVAPALNRIYELVSAMLKLAQLSGLPAMIGGVVATVLEALTRVVAMTYTIPAAMELMFVTIVDWAKWAAEQLKNLLPFTKKTHDADFHKSGQAYDVFKDVLKAAFAVREPYDYKAEDPGASTKRSAISQWEKMGLQLGLNPDAEANRQTAKNTAAAAKILERIASHLDSGGEMKTAYNSP